MNVMIIGSGGREHALARKVAESVDCNNLYIAPGNGGTGSVGENLAIDISDFYSVAEKVSALNIDMLIVGPEAPLVDGIREYFGGAEEFRDLMIIGPGKVGATLEGSKDFAKDFMKRHGIPTAAYETFKRGEAEQAANFIKTLQPPYVLKADGLAAGKGVLILDNEEEACHEIKLMLDEGKFGAASAKVVIEDFLDGIEMSTFAITDGKDYLLLPSAKDYKRIGEGDTGLNTGGMGAVSPVPFADEELLKKIEEKVVAPTVRGLEKDGIPYIGFLFFGLMIVDNEPFVIEYNVRMGDPETEVVMPRVKSDLLAHLAAAAKGELSGQTVEVDERFSTTVMLVSGGYPEAYEKGKKIEIRGQAEGDQILFHAGTKLDSGELITSGGRVISCTAYAENLPSALSRSYELAEKVNFDGKFFRRDIGKDLLT
ncbi:MAG: phosphoribosylamine--glycine ligase [Bacteroidota bacterium]